MNRTPMERFLTVKQKIQAMAEKYALENLGLDEKTYREILNEGLKRNNSLSCGEMRVGKLMMGKG